MSNARLIALAVAALVALGAPTAGLAQPLAATKGAKHKRHRAACHTAKKATAAKKRSKHRHRNCQKKTAPTQVVSGPLPAPAPASGSAAPTSGSAAPTSGSDGGPSNPPGGGTPPPPPSPCDSVFADQQVTQSNLDDAELSVNCLINQARAAAGVAPLALEPGGTSAPLWKSSSKHATDSVTAKSWSQTNGLVSHLDPGTAVPGTPALLQAKANEQINARILGAGYCAGGHSYRDAENTYGGSGTAATPRAAVNWWLNDPPHRATLLDPNLTEHRVGIVAGSAFPGITDAGAGTFVEDLGACS